MRYPGEIIKAGSNLNEMYGNQVAWQRKKNALIVTVNVKCVQFLHILDSPAQNTTVNFRNNVGLFFYNVLYFKVYIFI